MDLPGPGEARVSNGSVPQGFMRDWDFLTSQTTVGFSEKWSDVWS